MDDVVVPRFSSLTTNRSRWSGCSCCLRGCVGIELVGTAIDGDSAVRHGRGAGARRAVARHRHARHGRHRRRPRDRQADRSPAVVFVTAFDEFAVAAFDVEAVDYVMKPVAPTRLERALDRARAYVRQRRDKPGRAPSSDLAVARGILGVGVDRPGAASPRATSTGCRRSAITCGCTSAAAAG